MFFISQVVRAASPVLLRVITLGAFFIYCTVSEINSFGIIPCELHLTEYSIPKSNQEFPGPNEEFSITIENFQNHDENFPNQYKNFEN